MKKKQNSELLSNREKLRTEENFPQSEEIVMTEILFSESGKTAVKKTILPGSIGDDVTIETFPGSDICVTSEFLSYGSETMVVSKIISQGIKENVILEILITESGKIVARRFHYPKSEDKVSIEILYPKSQVKVKTNFLFSFPKTIETKKVYFPQSGKAYDLTGF